MGLGNSGIIYTCVLCRRTFITSASCAANRGYSTHDYCRKHGNHWHVRCGGINDCPQC